MATVFRRKIKLCGNICRLDKSKVIMSSLAAWFSFRELRKAQSSKAHNDQLYVCTTLTYGLKYTSSNPQSFYMQLYVHFVCFCPPQKACMCHHEFYDRLAKPIVGFNPQALAQFLSVTKGPEFSWCDSSSTSTNLICVNLLHKSLISSGLYFYDDKS